MLAETTPAPGGALNITVSLSNGERTTHIVHLPADTDQGAARVRAVADCVEQALSRTGPGFITLFQPLITYNVAHIMAMQLAVHGPPDLLEKVERAQARAEENMGLQPIGA